MSLYMIWAIISAIAVTMISFWLYDMRKEIPKIGAITMITMALAPILNVVVIVFAIGEFLSTRTKLLDWLAEPLSKE